MKKNIRSRCLNPALRALLLSSLVFTGCKDGSVVTGVQFDLAVIHPDQGLSVSSPDTLDDAQGEDHGDSIPAAVNRYVGPSAPPMQDPCVRFSYTPAPTFPQEMNLTADPRTPIIHQPGFVDESLLFGYQPTFTPGVVNYSLGGGPVIRDDLELQFLRPDASWGVIPLFSLAMTSLSRIGIQWTPGATGDHHMRGTFNDERVVWDRGCNVYTVINATRSSVAHSILMHSSDGGNTWGAYLIPGSDGATTAVKIEWPNQASILEQPPALLVHPLYHAEGVHTNLELVTIQTTPEGGLALSDPVLLSDRAVTGAYQAGAGNYAITDGDRVHIVFPGADRAENPIDQTFGTPVYGVTYDKGTQRLLSDPVLLGVSSHPGEKVDNHIQGHLVMDSEATLHVIIGAHHNNFVYVRSLAPRSMVSGWTVPVKVGRLESEQAACNNCYTYPAFTIDMNDRLHVVARWAGDGYKFRLVHMTRSPGAAAWSGHQVLVEPGRSYYMNWNHKLTLGNWGRLFLHYAYVADNLWADERAQLEARLGIPIEKRDPNCQDFTWQQALDGVPGAKYCDVKITADHLLGRSLLMLKPGEASWSLIGTAGFWSF